MRWVMNVRTPGKGRTARAYRKASVGGRKQDAVDEGGRERQVVQEGAQAGLGGLAVAQAHAHGLALLLQRPDLAC